MNAMLVIDHLRGTYLSDNIQQDTHLLKEYQELWRQDVDPDRRREYLEQIKRLKDSAEKYREEYETLVMKGTIKSQDLEEIQSQLQIMENT